MICSKCGKDFIDYDYHVEKDSVDFNIICRDCYQKHGSIEHVEIYLKEVERKYINYMTIGEDEYA